MIARSSRARWLGAAIELKVGPRIFSEYKDVEVKVEVQLVEAGAAKTMTILQQVQKRVPSELQNKVAGDLFSSLADTVFDLTGEKMAPSKPFEELNPHKVVFSPDIGLFAQHLIGEIQKQRDQITGNIGGLSQRIAGSPAIGAALVRKLQQWNPRFDRLSRIEKLNAGYEMIDNLIDSVRRGWASRWLFYGSNPPEPMWSLVGFQLERQQWAVWIAQQAFHYGITAVDKMRGMRATAVGASGAVLDNIFKAMSIHGNDPNPIVQRLYDLSVPVVEIWREGTATSEDQVMKLNLWAANQLQQQPWQKSLLAKPRVLLPLKDVFANAAGAR